MTDINEIMQRSVQQQLGNVPDARMHDPVKNYMYDKEDLNTKSMYHQFMDYKELRIIKRYVKSTIGAMTFARQHPVNGRERIHGVLQTDDNEKWYPYMYYAGGYYDEPSKVNLWRYESEVIELYEGIDDVNRFERWNEQALADGSLIEYDEHATYRYDDRSGMLVEGSKTVGTTRKPATIKGR